MTSKPPATCAFVATTFGFGPVAKAVAIAQALKTLPNAPHISFFGSGIAYDYAETSGAFDNIIRAEVDSPRQLARLIPRLSAYSSVFSVLNLEILKLWNQHLPALYFVDSLAWLWPAPPPGLENVTAYFVQDYFPGSYPTSAWTKQIPLTIVAPIETASREIAAPLPRRPELLVVSYSGCGNPYAPASLYELYSHILTEAIIHAAAGVYSEIIVCCNKRLAGFLDKEFAAFQQVRFGHYSHPDFMQLMATASLALVSPGVTITLEAIALNTTVRFLLPQNDSQALLSEHYRRTLGEHSCMAFSRFSPDFSFPLELTPEDLMQFSFTTLKQILTAQKTRIQTIAYDLLSPTLNFPISLLKQNISGRWNDSGQMLIANIWAKNHNLSTRKEASR